MKLLDLISIEEGIQDLRGTFSSKTEEEVSTVIKTVLDVLQDTVQDYVNSLPMPGTIQEAYVPVKYECLPTFVRREIIAQLDILYTDDELLQKFHSYIELCNIVGDTVIHHFKLRYDLAVKSLGMTDVSIEHKFIRKN